MQTVLVVDDEKNTRDGLRDILEEEYDVFVAPDIQGAMEVLKDGIDVLLTDLRLGGESGMDLMERVKELKNPPVSIVMTAYGSVDTAVEAMRRGAYDFVTKPVNLDRLEMLIRRALRERQVVRENKELKARVQRPKGLEALLGRSEAMQQVFDLVKQVAPSRATVLIQGETGTGKELAARAIHNLSPRADKKFVAVHCKAFSAQLLESELFGHEKGAFTGAFERRIGRFEQAAGGTLFLDEIGEIDENTQVKILRVLGERTYERVGGNKTLEADVRLVAATNRDLSQLVEDGKFRDDLYFRINVVQLTMPPLRDRLEDVPLLARAFVGDACKENDISPREIPSEVIAALINYPWPGNVRELRTAMEHAVVMSTSAELRRSDLPPKICQEIPMAAIDEQANEPATFNLHATERQLILRALDATRGNRTEAAKRLGMSRRTLHRRLKELNIIKNRPSNAKN